ncbi:RNA-binding domain-containing protein [Suillus clintonianus]|uniref:RNA-binding domain-containing protein n=1 Tax=Suillus clintonianus TaxID=1904413 RepID=UPI001B883A13|nr:RNA-binding domain-containing protein [Suillus clintonianus]KAG2157138.1 RNA-binding domain-containing protein [Suillus clintonianus]
MEEGTKGKKTIFIGGIGDDVDETVIFEHFSPFGDIIEVQLPPAPTNPSRPTEFKHRGFAFVTYSSPTDAQDAIDNMDLNELQGKVLKVNQAKPMKGLQPPDGNRAIWESEEWLQRHAKPLAQSGGVQGRTAQRGPSVEKGEEQANDEDADAMEE